MSNIYCISVYSERDICLLLPLEFNLIVIIWQLQLVVSDEGEFIKQGVLD